MNPLLYLEIVLWGLLLAFTSERHAAQRSFHFTMVCCKEHAFLSFMRKVGPRPSNPPSSLCHRDGLLTRGCRQLLVQQPMPVQPRPFPASMP
jgi:hypothetical protein